MHLVGAVSALPNKARTLRCGTLLLDLDRCRALVGDIDTGLSPLEFALVQLLVRHRGAPMSKAAISAGLPVPADPRMVDVYVSRSRAKLAAAGVQAAITTVWGRGYQIGEPDDRSKDLRPTEPPNSWREVVLAPA